MPFLSADQVNQQRHGIEDRAFAIVSIIISRGRRWCVAVEKRGSCPGADDWRLSSAGCTQSCRRDADCDGAAKCCDSVDCAGKVCFEPEMSGQ